MMLLRRLYARLAHSYFDLKKETIYEYDRIATPEEYDGVCSPYNKSSMAISEHDDDYISLLGSH